MTLIHRHILWELTKSALAAVALFAFILVTGNAIKEILAFLLDGRLNLWLFIQLLGLLLPYVISYALPMGVLMGVLSLLGRMCATGEYTAYRACGVSLNYLSIPIIGFSLAGVLLLILINFYYAPAARASYFTSMAQMIRSDPLRFILPKTFVKEFPGYILYARERNNTTLTDFWIWELDTHNRPLKLIRAKEGKLTYNAADDSLQLELKEGFSELRDPKNPDDLKAIRPTLGFDHGQVRLPLNRLVTGENRGGLTTLTLNKLLEKKHEVELQVQKDPTDRTLRQNLSQIRFQIQQNFAFAFAVLSLCVIGIPLGLKASRKETSANLVLALGLGLGYYFMVVLTSWFSRFPELRPDLLVWIPNILFQVLGVALFAKALKN